ncbi:MAG: hypothetical protein M1537_01675 [Nitrospirae bacterium]|nr:hypothetical protein [Nitrospirota bacterium]MCL5284178.1 hypothetical protein [Nitrospirota bacterium]
MGKKVWFVLCLVMLSTFTSITSVLSCDDWVLWRVDESSHQRALRKDAFETKAKCRIGKEMQEASDAELSPTERYSYVCLPSSMKP